jgi:phosphohistidine swiveling domain-containing protein
MAPLVLALDDPSAELAVAGGKGASLARLAAGGLPVPPGFHVTTEAYVRFVAQNHLQQEILAALQTGPQEAAGQIAQLFARHGMPDDIAEAIRKAYAAMHDAPVAVRSSATAEDLPDASFAGQQDTYLDIRGEAAVLDAVQRCWASLWTARAIEYRSVQGIANDDVSLAVVVQELVPADAAGVLFTADPVSGASDRVVVNAASGLGEALVSGEADPDAIVIEKASGGVIERRGEQVLETTHIGELFHLGTRIEQLYERPMDVEWAVHGDRVFVLQARPITVLTTYEEWNDSLRGEYLWTNGNLGEAIPDVMTPATWSMVKLFMADGMATTSLPEYPGYGNIGGRFYMNLSMAYSLAAAFGMKSRFKGASEQVFGRLPEGIEIPPAPLSRWQVIRALLPVIRKVLKRVKANTRRLPEFMATSPQRCEELRQAVARADDPKQLAALWRREIEPFFHESCFMLEAAGRQDSGALVTVRAQLAKLVGESDMNAMTSGLTGAGTGGLESLGPLLGLARLVEGEIDRDTFARTYGHRGASEFELSAPRPAEDPAWIDKQLASLRTAKEQPVELLARQEAASRAAWDRFGQRYPRKVAKLRKQVQRWVKAAQDREQARSEVIRAFWVVRAFVLRAGELTGHGDDLFFLPIQEILAVLDGDTVVLQTVPARRATYERYKALPPYPAVILGRFDPLRWAADPGRRSDIYNEHGAAAPISDTVKGFAGAVGVVEGTARVIDSVARSEELLSGEILVTTVTNIGWTPLFPRAAAVVTDVGAPLSHAAIVARELGIPAVVGCGNATARIHTGDRIRVDGEHGTVEILA